MTGRFPRLKRAAILDSRLEFRFESFDDEAASVLVGSSDDDAGWKFDDGNGDGGKAAGAGCLSLGLSIQIKQLQNL